MLKRIILTIIFSAIFLQANNFRDGMLAYKKGDYTKAKISFEKSISEDKVIHGTYMLGRLNLFGQGTQINLPKAIQLLNYASDYGNIPAGCYLSKAYMSAGIHSSLLAEGFMPGLIKHVPYCKRVYEEYKTYSFPAEFHYDN